MNRYRKLQNAIQYNISREHRSTAELSAVWGAIHRVVGDLVTKSLGDKYSYSKWSEEYNRVMDTMVSETVARIKRMGTTSIGTMPESIEPEEHRP